MTHPSDPGPFDLGRKETAIRMPGGREPRAARLGNALITLGGADKAMLGVRSVDRGYYIGVGSGLLFTATLSALSMTLASSIAFGVPFGSAGLNLLGMVWFVLILGLDRWLVADQTSGFVKPAAGGASVPLAWLGHAAVELFKVSPRILIALVSSLLFAKFMLLAIYDNEIQAQLKMVQKQQIARFEQDVNAYAQNIKSQAKTVLAQAAAQKKQARQDYDDSQKAKAAAYKRMTADIAAANKRGVYCTEEPKYAVATNPNTGLTYNVFTGNVLVCPPELQSVTDTYNNVAAQTETQPYLRQQLAGIDKKFAVGHQERLITTAQSVAAQKMAPYQPKMQDGLLAREHALQLLTSKPAGTCPTPPTEAEIATNDACISLYSPGAAAEMTIFRYFLLAFEMMPVGMKVINSLTKRRPYAWEMAAREETLRQNAEELIEEARKRAETDLAAFVHRERVRLEEESALQEYRMREIARQRRRLGLHHIRSRVAASLADNQASRGLRDRLRRMRGKDGQPDNLVPMSDYVDPRNTQADPGIRVINSEDFLWS